VGKLVRAVAAAFSVFVAGATNAEDIVKTLDSRLPGKVAALSPTEVTVIQAGAEKKVPVNEVLWIAFDEEKDLPYLRRGRDAAVTRKYEEAIRALENVKVDEIDRDAVKQDVEFYTALSSSKLALEGRLEIPEAGQQMRTFLSAHPQSYHFFEANEVVGDLLVALGQFAKAREYYAQVGKAPWPEYKLRAAAAMGRVLSAENKPAEALKYFQHVLDANVDTPQAGLQRTAAALGKARCLAETGKHDEAIKLVEAMIAKADPDNSDILGPAYLILGIALEKAGRVQDAQYALLRVDTQYPASRDVHAESLYHLARLWTALKKPERAKEARSTLAEQFGDTRWGQLSGQQK
jgi:tetratricopeptide (TPR) repeat protein